MFPTGLIGVCSLGVRKVIFGGFEINENFFFLKNDSNYFNMTHRNKSLKELFSMGA